MLYKNTVAQDKDKVTLVLLVDAVALNCTSSTFILLVASMFKREGNIPEYG